MSAFATNSQGTPAVDSPGRTEGAALTLIPEKSAREWGIALTLFVASCLYCRPFYDYVGFHIDEGLALQGAQRILQGQVLYRDFFSFYTPGSYYWLALLFRIFGSSILVGRAALMVYGGLFSVLTYLLARRVCTRSNALLAVVPALLVSLPGCFVVFHGWDSTLWALLALYCAVRLLETRRWTWAFATGSLAAAACLVEQSRGCGLVIGLGAGFLILVAKDGLESWRWRENLAALMVGSALPVLGTLGYFARHGALGPMMADLMWPLRHYSAPSRLGYGAIETPFLGLLSGSPGRRAFGLFVTSPLFIVSALPIFAACIFAYRAFRLYKDGTAGQAARYYVLVSAALSGLLLATLATGRPSAINIMLQAPLFSIVLAWMVEAARTPTLRVARTLGLSYLLVSFAVLGFSFFTIPSTATATVQSRRGLIRTTPDTAEALAFIQSRVAPNQKILVYPYQPLYYYLTGTYAVSQYDRLLAGTYTPSQFEEMAGELKSSQPSVVLFNPTFTEVIPGMCPNAPLGTVVARDPVVDYLFSRYRACRTLGNPMQLSHVVFMVRDDLSCSGAGPDLAGKR